MRQRRWRWFIGCGAVVLAAAAACASGSSSSDRMARSAQDESAGGGAAAAAPAGEAGAPTPARQLASKATVSLEADDPAEVQAAISRLALDAGGILFGQEAAFDDQPRVVVTVKVPPERLGEVLEGIGALGTVTTQEVETEDVTDQAVDLDARIASTEASVARLRGFLDGAGNVSELTAVEGELVARETELERLVAQRRTLAGRVELATVTVTVVQHVAGGAPADLPGFLDGLEGGWSALVTTATVTGAVFGALLPFLPFLVIAAVVGRWAVRRGRSTEPAPPLPAPPPGG